MRQSLWMCTAVSVVALLFGQSDAASAQVTFDWTTVGNVGNAPDTTGFGSVANEHRIAKHEVTNAQYAEFLNKVDAAGTNPNAVYNA
ncbi:MAG: PEP-CTERM sorting domain-containing protein, partial [Planctomycetes bacterium]|nr:PEP-CTERM sorting domain-containing protein [Planctomycetota bacterium]